MKRRKKDEWQHAQKKNSTTPKQKEDIRKKDNVRKKLDRQNDSKNDTRENRKCKRIANDDYLYDFAPYIQTAVKKAKTHLHRTKIQD